MSRLAFAIARGNWAIEIGTGLMLFPKAYDLLTRPDAVGQPSSEQKQLEPVAFLANASGKTVFNAGEASNEGSIGILNLNGVLLRDTHDDCGGPVYGTIDIAEQVKALDDSGVSSIVILMNSPGGQMDGTATLADAIKSCRAKTIGLVNDGMACSACYWVGSACDEIYATHAHSEIGSIGVYATLADFTEYYKSLGARIEDIYAEQSDEKNIGFREWMNGNAEEFRKRLTSACDEFISVVQTNRQGKLNLSAGDPFKGAVYNAKEATAIGLIDGIKTYDEVMDGLLNEKLTFI